MECKTTFLRSIRLAIKKLETQKLEVQPELKEDIQKLETQLEILDLKYNIRK